ncbi:hypothetical protein CGRA01v4_00864 [Colletotrichum graminicola]|nr:hypothetical protein CGRA01v4_00864 [Colletotrichum graminicola]
MHFVPLLLRLWDLGVSFRTLRRGRRPSVDTTPQGLLWRQGWREMARWSGTQWAQPRRPSSARLSLTSEDNSLEGIGFSGEDRYATASSRAICRYVGPASVKTAHLWSGWRSVSARCTVAAYREPVECVSETLLAPVWTPIVAFLSFCPTLRAERSLEAPMEVRL